MSPKRPEIAAQLTSPRFLGALATLFMNDWILKAAFHTWWTGKLSDFAGLYALGVFCVAFLPRHRRVVCVMLAAAFVVWKSPLSSPLIAAWNALGVGRVARVVDYTDWLALVVLLPVAREPAARSALNARVMDRVLAAVSGAAAVLLFAATSVVRIVPTPETRAFVIPADASTVIDGLYTLKFEPYSYRSDRKSPAYRVWLSVRYPPERWLTFSADLRNAGRDTSVIRMLELHGWYAGPTPSAALLDSLFDVQILEPLSEWMKTHPATPGDSCKLSAPVPPSSHR